ncbi:hypothetical protein Ct61P_05074 [Colletotrichum tofieldiae]|nr:hypothetical protein Ct61P_05074 [Colletotrichum tofieldiae]
MLRRPRQRCSAEHRLEVGTPGQAHPKVRELRGKEGLYIARVGCDEVLGAQEGDAEGMGPESGEARGDMVWRALLTVRTQGGENSVDAEGRLEGSRGGGRHESLRAKRA